MTKTIETMIADLTTALNRNSDAQEAVVKALSGAKPAAGGTKAADKPKAETKPKAEAKTETKSAATTVDDVAKKVTAFLKTGDEDERATRKEQVSSIIQHYGATRFTTIDPANFDEALGYLNDFDEGRTPEFAAEEGGDDDIV